MTVFDDGTYAENESKKKGGGKMVLYTLPEGETARIHNLQAEADIRNRLGDLGFVPGTPITCLGRSPLGDPTAYLVRSAVIALRKEDAEKVFVEREG